MCWCKIRFVGDDENNDDDNDDVGRYQQSSDCVVLYRYCVCGRWVCAQAHQIESETSFSNYLCIESKIWFSHYILHIITLTEILLWEWFSLCVHLVRSVYSWNFEPNWIRNYIFTGVFIQIFWEWIAIVAWDLIKTRNYFIICFGNGRIDNRIDCVTMHKDWTGSLFPIIIFFLVINLNQTCSNNLNSKTARLITWFQFQFLFTLGFSMGLTVLNWIPFPHETAIDLFYIHGWFFFVALVSFSYMWVCYFCEMKTKKKKIENDFHRLLHFKNLLTWYNHNHHS